nr:retropepsin-like aspartic protease [Thalassotalea crassostreae]
MDDSKKIGKAMLWMTWLILFCLLVWFFQDVLDKQWNPNTAPEIGLSEDGNATVTLEQNKYGHYVTMGSINDTNVIFLLDTGATHVSIPEQVAQHLDLPVQGSHYVQTANGSVKVYETVIEQLSIGNIILYNVRANINPGMKSNEILLGMSALKQLEFHQSGKYLHLSEQR